MGLTLVSKLQEITIEVIGLDVILIYREEPSEGSEGEGDWYWCYSLSVGGNNKNNRMRMMNLKRLQ